MCWCSTSWLVSTGSTVTTVGCFGHKISVYWRNVIYTLGLIDRSTRSIPLLLELLLREAKFVVTRPRYSSRELRSESDTWSNPHGPLLVNGAVREPCSHPNRTCDSKVVLRTPFSHGSCITAVSTCPRVTVIWSLQLSLAALVAAAYQNKHIFQTLTAV
jgi:hypothetical protein